MQEKNDITVTIEFSLRFPNSDGGLDSAKQCVAEVLAVLNPYFAYGGMILNIPGDNDEEVRRNA